MCLNENMNKGSTLFLKIVLLLTAGIVLAGLLWFPHLEGRNAHADIFTIYFKDPFLAYVYLSSISFFVPFYQAFKLLGYIEQNKAFSQISVNALRNIKFSALVLAGLVAGAVPQLAMFAQEDDAPGVVLILVVIIFAAFVIATAAAVFQKLLQNAVDLKSENDLTV
jgi:hypothetical protein